jgi:hypothetical protein
MRVMPLTSAEALLIRALAGRPGEPVSREELAQKCGLDAGERTIDVQVTRLSAQDRERHEGAALFADGAGQGIPAADRGGVMFSVKSFLPRTLLGRSLMILITPILLIQVIATFVFFDRHWGKMTMRLAYSVAGETAMIASVQLRATRRRREMQDIIGYASQHLDLLVGFKPGAADRAEIEQLRAGRVEIAYGGDAAGATGDKPAAPVFLTIDDDEKWIIIDVQLSESVLSVILPQRRLFSSSGYIFLLMDDRDVQVCCLPLRFYSCATRSGRSVNCRQRQSVLARGAMSPISSRKVPRKCVRQARRFLICISASSGRSSSGRRCWRVFRTICARR